MTGHSTKTNPDLSLFAVQRKLHTFAGGLSIRTFHLKQALTMFTVISIMFAGTVIGRLLRNTGIPGKMGRPISYTILLLLFLLGISIGTDKNITAHLATLGRQALFLSLAATTGSVLAGWAVYHMLFRNGNQKPQQE